MTSHEETLVLIEKAQSGDLSAKETLICENLPLVKAVVKRFRGRAEYDDLIQLGSIGFLKAIVGFNVSFGVRFSTYAVPMIAGEIKRYLRDDGTLKVSRYLKSLSQRIRAEIEASAQNGDKEPSVQDLAEKLNVEQSDIVIALDASKYVVSLSECAGDDELALEDKLSDGTTPETGIEKMMLRDGITALPEREKKIIILRYFRDKTQTEVAEELGVSQVQVSRLENKILEKLRKKIE